MIMVTAPRNTGKLFPRKKNYFQSVLYRFRNFQICFRTWSCTNAVARDTRCQVERESAGRPRINCGMRSQVYLPPKGNH